MDLVAKFLKLLREGKNDDQAMDEVIAENPDVNADEAAKALIDAKNIHKKSLEIKSAQQKTEEKAAFESSVKAEVEAQLKKIDTGSKTVATSAVQVKDNWQERYTKGLVLKMKGSNRTTDETSELHDIMGKMVQKSKDMKVLLPETDASGGYFADPEFDMEIDKLVYASFPLLEKIKIRPGGLKTEINSISTFDLTYRANSDTSYGTASPTTAQSELKYRDAGAMVYIAENLFGESAYNLTSELMSLASDAKGRLLVEQIIAGKTTGDPFNGIWFTSGITTVAAKNSGGSGRIVCKDLSNMFLSCAAQTRANGVFLMDSKEAMVLAEETDGNGRPLNIVELKDGYFIHKPTGKVIIPIDQNSRRTLNGFSAATGGTDIAVLFCDITRYREYQLGGFRVDMSRDFTFDKDQVAMRYIMTDKRGIPAQSLSSFVALTGIKNSVA